MNRFFIGVQPKFIPPMIFSNAVSRPFLSALLVLLVCRSLQAASSQKPNIIVILTDDQGYADLGVQQQLSDLKTPHIDALAREGVRMTAGYVTAPQCSPSRAGLLTGRYQQRIGIDTIPDMPLPVEEITIAERLKKSGYVCGMVGKWHLDPNATSLAWAKDAMPGVTSKAGRLTAPIPRSLLLKYSPLAQGFNECFQGELQNYLATFDTDGQSLAPEGTSIVRQGYRLDIQSDAALAFLKRHHEQPFFLYLAYYGPHVPLEATDKYLARFPGEMPERRRYALAMLSAIDDGVGRIKAALKEYGVDENTMIVFTSDNGAPLKKTMPDTKPITENGWDGSRNDPWLGEKGMVLEGGLRVPFIVSYPKVLPKGKVYELPVSTLDIAATAIALAGQAPSKDLDGVNLIPHLTGAVATPPHDNLYWRFWNQTSVLSGRWKFVQAGNRARYLFDLANDPHEKHDVLGEHPEIVRELSGKLTKWTSELKPAGNPDRPLNAEEEANYSHYLGLSK